MKIVVDAMGGDNAPYEIVKGALEAAEQFGVEIMLVGRGEDILRSMEKLGLKSLPAGVEVANATEVITMEDEPATAAKVKSDSSMTVGLRLLHEGKADAMVSAGSTGALLSGATLITKRIHGIRRAALAPTLPSMTGGVILCDCGANAECTPEYLLQFAYMGYYYAKYISKVAEPRVGLLNNGTEPTKGTALQKESYALLQAAHDAGRINFVGNVEASGVLMGDCDVCVCDGYAGNILLKGIEGAGKFLMAYMKAMFTKNAKTKLAAGLVRGDLRGMKSLLDPNGVGGTLLLGISAPVVKAHGASDARAIRNAVGYAVEAVKADICRSIADNIEYMKVEKTV